MINTDPAREWPMNLEPLVSLIDLLKIIGIVYFAADDLQDRQQ